jgi:hypothetical protein
VPGADALIAIVADGAADVAAGLGNPETPAAEGGLKQGEAPASKDLQQTSGVAVDGTV